MDITVTNPAAAAINEISGAVKTPCRQSSRVLNGIRTCGPIVSAALSRDEGELDHDIEEMLNAAQKLINDVKAELHSKNVDTNDDESAAINSFCIAVISMNWTQSQEIYRDWVNPIVNAITKPDISSEYVTDYNSSTDGELLASNIISASEVFTSLSSNPEMNLTEFFPKAVHEIHQNINKAINKLSNYHVTSESTDLIRHHLTIHAGKIFKAIIDREHRIHVESQRRSSINKDSNNEVLSFSFEEILRNFDIAMDSFVTAIYTNSRITK